MDLKHLITKAGAAKRLGVPPSTIHRAIERGELAVSCTADGYQLLQVRAVDAWGRAERRPGRKPQASDAA